MSLIREYREEYLNNNKLEPMYIKNTEEFVNYVESIDLGENIQFIEERHLADFIRNEHKKGRINTVSTMDNNLNVIKNFYSYLQSVKKNKSNLIGDIIQYDKFKNDLIEELELSDTKTRECLQMETIIQLLKYFEDDSLINNRKRKNDILLNIFIRLTLVAPTYKNTILNLKFSDFDTEFRWVNVNGVKIKLTSALSVDIKSALENIQTNTNKKYTKDEQLFGYLRGGQTNNIGLTDSMYLVLRDIGYDVPLIQTGKSGSHQVDCIRNTAIMELLKNNTNPLLVSKISGLTLHTLDKKIKQFYNEFDIEYDRLINNSVCKAEYYQYI